MGNPLCSVLGVIEDCNVFELPARHEGLPSPGYAIEFPRKDGEASAALIVLTGEDTVHWHQKTLETYLCLSGEGLLRIGAERHNFKPGDSVIIPLMTDHAAMPLGDEPLVLLVVSQPSFDPEDFIQTYSERVPTDL